MRRTWTGLILVALAAGALALATGGPVHAQLEDQAPGRCELACRQVAQTALEQCRERGGSAERCRLVAREAKETCMARCGAAVEPRPDPVEPAPRACRERCLRYGEQVMEKCMALPIGPTAEQCARRVRQAVQLCMEKTCPEKEPPRQVQPEPRACKDACETRARAVYEMCVKGSTGTTPPDDCARKARASLADCLQKHCAPGAVSPAPQPAPGAACREACGDQVRAWLEQCRAQPGADPARCRERAAKKLEACLEACRP